LHISSASGIEAAGIKPDMIAGSSMGAVIGGIYSVGPIWTAGKVITSISLYGYLDLNLPLSAGLMKGEKLEELVRIFTHNKTFAETKTPFCCVAVMRKRRETGCAGEGPLHDSIRASMSIPAIFEPVRLNGRTYIDGGVLERVPCKALRDRGMDVVIGVDVGITGISRMFPIGRLPAQEPYDLHHAVGRRSPP
jgi:NTE family protein